MIFDDLTKQHSTFTRRDLARAARRAGISADHISLDDPAIAWQRGRDKLQAKDVLVIDEAGMIGSAQMRHFLDAAVAAGAKLVLLGDYGQLQGIEAGAAFRVLGREGGKDSTLDYIREPEPAPAPTGFLGRVAAAWRGLTTATP